MQLDDLGVERSSEESLSSTHDRIRVTRSGRSDLSTASLDNKIERAVTVLNDCKRKLRVAAVLPNLLQDEELLRLLFTSEEISRLKSLCEKYIGKCTIDIDFNLLKAIELVNSNKEALKVVKMLVQDLPEYLKTFVISICDVCNVLQVRLKTSASEELLQEEMTRLLYQDKLNIKASISGVRQQLQAKEVNVQWRIAEKQAIISKYQRDLSDGKWQNNIKIKKELVSANNKMNEICNQSEQHLSKLAEEAEKIKKSYKQILHENVIIYKKLKEKKERILAQLEGWIRKYDADVADKILENEQLQKELTEWDKKLSDFIVKYEKQEALFNEVTAAKDTEEKMAQEEKLMLFMMNRAAKIIQRAWRKYKSKRKKGKGKGKKGKKGKK